MFKFSKILFLALFLAFGFSVPGVTPQAVAQEATVETIDYTAWNSVAGRAEAAIETGRASNEAFESLRSEVVIWRERFLRGQDVNAARIKTLSGQLATLGAAPTEGTESEEIAVRRTELTEQLAKARAPIKAAEEAFSRADGLASEIDSIIRDRQTDALLKLEPTPVNPANWPAAINEMLTTLRAISTEVTKSWRSEVQQASFRDGLPKTLFLLIIAVVLVFRGRPLMERFTGLVLDNSSTRARALAGFFTSLTQIIVPVLGIYLLKEALQSTGLLGLRGQIVTDTLPEFGVLIFGARWLGLRLFPKRADVAKLFHPTPERSRTMRRSATSLGIVVGLGLIISVLSDYDGHSASSRTVLIFPIAVLTGLLLWRIGRVLTKIGRDMQANDTPISGARGLTLVGRAATALSLVGIVLSAIGYINAGIFLLFPTTYTLALLGLLLLLNELIREIYAFVTRVADEQARAALIPTLVSVALVVVSLPIFALFWGARIADITELWAKFREGFTLGETRISPESFLTFVIVFAALYVGTRLLQGALKSNVLPKTRINSGGQTAIVSGLGYIGIFLAAIIAINSAGLDLSSLAIVAGALSVGIGFGLQNIVQNFVSGIILLIERPVAEGDWVEVGGYVGIVRKISVRSTLIETFDRTDVIVPNGDFIAGAVTNWTRTNSVGRIKVPVGVAYGNDTRKVAEILMEIAKEHPLVTINPEPGVDFMGFGADSLDFQIRAVLSDVNYSVSVKTEMNHRIAERFKEEGIEIPFAQRDIWLRNPEALTGGKPAEPEAPLKPSKGSNERELNLTEDDMELDPALTATTADDGDVT